MEAPGRPKVARGAKNNYLSTGVQVLIKSLSDLVEGRRKIWALYGRRALKEPKINIRVQMLIELV